MVKELNSTEKIIIKKAILKYVLNFDWKDVEYHVSDLHNLDVKLVKEILIEFYDDVSRIYDNTKI